MVHWIYTVEHGVDHGRRLPVCCLGYNKQYKEALGKVQVARFYAAQKKRNSVQKKMKKKK